jgi:hypothetical protein
MAARRAMSTLLLDVASSLELDGLGLLTPVSRSGGQGRVYVPEHRPEALGSAVVIKLYRSAPRRSAPPVLAEMVRWSRWLAPEQRELLYHHAAWPLATITTGGALTGILMRDVRSRFEVPFLMPSGRTASVLLQLEHLLGPDGYLEQRGLPVALDTPMRAGVAERISGAFAFLHRHAIAVSDVSPSNLLISFAATGPEVCFIDCDSMVFHGRQALASVETGDWQMPPSFVEPPLSRAADAYKLGLIVLRLFARSHDARTLEPHVQHVPEELRGLLARAISREAPNRPPAGEWQLALRRTLANSALSRRHPGPKPRASRAPRQQGSQPALERPAPAPSGGAPAAALAPTASRAAARHQAARRSPAGFSGLTVAWLVAGVLLVVLFVRLLESAAVSSPSGGLAGAGQASLPPGVRYLQRSSRAYEPPGGYSAREEGRAFEPGAPGR